MGETMRQQSCAYEQFAHIVKVSQCSKHEIAKEVISWGNYKNLPI